MSVHRLALSWPEFHPITSSRYYSLSNDVTEGVITTRSNRMKFRLALSKIQR